jgi:hypothetical protein
MKIDYEHMQYTYICTIIYVSMCIVIHKYHALKIDERCARYRY